MEEQLAALVAQVAALEAKANTTNTMFAETYYYLTIPLMIITVSYTHLRAHETR